MSAIVKSYRVLFVFLALFLPVLFGFVHAEEEEAKLLLSIQKEKVEDKTGRLPVAERTAMFEILKQALVDAGFNVILQEDMLAAIQQTEKSLVLGEMQDDENGNSNDMQSARYFVQLSLDTCQPVLKEFLESDGTISSKRVNQLSLTIRVVDAKNGTQICSLQNSAPVYGQTTKAGLEGALKELVQEFTKAMPEKFRPVPLVGTVLKMRDDGTILVKIPTNRVKCGVFLDLFRLEELDLGDDDDEIEDEYDEVYLGTVKIIEIKKSYCVCIPEGKVMLLNTNEDRKDIARTSTRKIK